MPDDTLVVSTDPIVCAIAEALVVGDDQAFSQLPPELQQRLIEKAVRVADALAAAPKRPTTVIQAIAAVMRDLPGIGKNQESGQGYQYRGIEAITAHAQALFGKYGVVLVPRVTKRKVKEFSINSKPWTEDELRVTYTAYGPSHATLRERRVLDADGHVVVIDEVVSDKVVIGPLVGLGRDNSDKGANKSMTQAFKYALIQTLCIGDKKDDPDADIAREGDTHARPRPQQRPPQQRRGRADQNGWFGPEDRKEHLERLRAPVEALDVDERDALRAWAEEQGIPNPPLTKDQWQAFYDKAIEIGANWSPPGDEAPPASPPTTEPAALPLDAPPLPPDASVQVTEEAIAEVQRMSKEEVDAELTVRGFTTEGNVSTRRQRLARALIRERASTTHPTPAEGTQDDQGPHSGDAAPTDA